MKQQLYASVYSSQGTMEQLLISRTIQLLNSEEELTSVQQVRDEKEKLEAEVKILSGMKWEVDQLRTKESKDKSIIRATRSIYPYFTIVENKKELEILQDEISSSQNENKKLEAEVKLLSGMKLEVSQLKTKESKDILSII